MKQVLFIPLFLLVPFLISGQSHSWEPLDAKGSTEKRHENAFVQAGDKFILIGGRGQKKTDIYDTQSRKWTKAAQPPMEVHHVQAVSLDGLVYLLGGFTGGWPYETPLSHVLIYDPLQDVWQIGPKIPEGRRRGAAGVAVHNDKIYMINGIINGHTSGWVNWFDEFDPYTNTWKKLPNSPEARDHFQAAVIDDKLYVAGGRRSGSAETGFAGTVGPANVYNFKTRTWEVLPEIPTQRAGSATGILDGNLVVLGGESDAQQAAHDEVEMLNVDSGKWKALPSLNKGRHGTQVISLDNKLVIGAGSGDRGGGPELNSFEVLSTEENPSFELDSLMEGKLVPSSEELIFDKDEKQQLSIKNSSKNKAVVITYLETDEPGVFEVVTPFPTPFILAPEKEVFLEVSPRENAANSSATLFVKRLGESAPLEIKLKNDL